MRRGPWNAREESEAQTQDLERRKGPGMSECPLALPGRPAPPGCRASGDEQGSRAVWVGAPSLEPRSRALSGEKVVWAQGSPV